MARGLGSVRGRVAVVTGAASGIGRATAHLLGRRGAVLALSDIDAVGLKRVSEELLGVGVRSVAVPTDVSDAVAVEHFAARVGSELGVPDLIVNAAGIAVLGDFLATPLSDWERVFEVNLKGTVHVCRAFLPGLVARGGGGHLVNVASASAFVTPEGLSAYGATKHALVGLSQSLAGELAEHGIGVSLVAPGFVDTPIVRALRLHGYADPEHQRNRIAAFYRRRGLSAERVADRIVRAAERGESVVAIGFEAHLLHALARLAPRRAASWLAWSRRVLEKLGAGR